MLSGVACSYNANTGMKQGIFVVVVAVVVVVVDYNNWQSLLR